MTDFPHVCSECGAPVVFIHDGHVTMVELGHWEHRGTPNCGGDRKRYGIRPKTPCGGPCHPEA